MSFDWYPWHVQKYRRDTRHLSLAECGAYRRLIDEYMMTGEELPDNDAALARILGVGKDEWLAVAPVVRAFFHPQNGKLVHKRCHQTLMQQASLQHAYSMRAKSGAEARWKEHRENKRIANGLMLQASSKNASRMLNDATRQDISKNRVPREAPLARSPDGELRGALPQSATTAPAPKRPADVTRAELDAQIAARRAHPDGLDIPPELRRV